MLWSSKPINTEAFDYFPALKRVRDYFEKNYSEPISLSDAARLAGLETKHFSKVFSRNVGIGFKEWTDIVRVEKAIDAIRKEEQPISTIGFAVGFQNLRTFQRVFKKHARTRARDFKRDVLHQFKNKAS